MGRDKRLFLLKVRNLRLVGRVGGVRDGDFFFGRLDL